MVKKTRAFEYVPLSNSFFLAGILGFIVSAVYLPKISMTWAFTLGMVFLIMIVASLVSMVKAIPEPQLK